LLAPVVACFRPQRVILFGSLARDEATGGSDIDLLVIVDDDTPPEKFRWRARYEACRFYPHAADIFPMRAETFERNRTIIGALAVEADSDGIVVYGSPKRSPSMKPADPHARWEAVKRGLCGGARRSPSSGRLYGNGSSLIRIGRLSLPAGRRETVKGLSGSGRQKVPRDPLARATRRGGEIEFPDISELVATVETWSHWVVAYRYPSAQEPEPAELSEDELRRALATIDALAARLRAARPK
jgi:hypothetical protein